MIDLNLYEQNYVDECVRQFITRIPDATPEQCEKVAIEALSAIRVGDYFCDRILSSEIVYEDILDAEIIAEPELADILLDEYRKGASLKFIDIAESLHLI